MKRKIVLFLLTIFLCSAFGDVVITRRNLIELKEKSKNLTYYIPNDLYRIYNNNELKFEKDFKNTVFKIRGKVTKIRRGFFDEYIVELECTDNWLTDLAIVYPKRISDAMKNELMDLKIGQIYEALVVGRSSWSYVDVPVWDAGGVYRTEP